jgi:hypothetical protein
MDARFLRQIFDYKRFAEQCRKLSARATEADDKAILDEMAIAWDLAARDRERQLAKTTSYK